MKELDEKYNDLARTALFAGLHGCKFEDDINVEIEKSEIVNAFDRAGDILRSNRSDHHYRLIADAVFVTCICFTRCLFYPREARVLMLQGNEHSITADQQLDVLRRNIDELDKLASQQSQPEGRILRC